MRLHTHSRASSSALPGAGTLAPALQPGEHGRLVRQAKAGCRRRIGMSNADRQAAHCIDCGKAVLAGDIVPDKDGPAATEGSFLHEGGDGGALERKRAVLGKSVSSTVELGGRRTL